MKGVSVVSITDSLPFVMFVLGILAVLYAVWSYIKQWLSEEYVQPRHLEHLLFIAVAVVFLGYSIGINANSFELSQETTYWLYVILFALVVVIMAINAVVQARRESRRTNRSRH